MSRIAREKRMLIVVWATIALLLLGIASMSFNAYGVEDKAASSNATVSEATTSSSSDASAQASSSTASTDASSSSGESASSSSAESSSSSAAEPEPAKGASESAATSDADSTTFIEEVAALVEEALARDAVPANRFLRPVTGVVPDSAGAVFTFVSPLVTTRIDGDLYWISNEATLSDSKIGNDVMAAAFQMEFIDVDVDGDVRVAGQSVHLSDAIIAGNVDVGALEVTIDGDSAANGYYVGGGSVSFEGAAKRFIAYGQSVYFDGIVDGDVTLSAQDIVIGPHAKITGLLDIRSGQNLGTLDIPAGAQIARIDTNLDHPNTIDQITQIRAAIAPYFQIGSLLFIAVSFILMGLAALWGFGPKLHEANRLVRRYPLAVLVLGCIALMLAFVIVMLGTVLIFTIPLSLGVVFILLAVMLFCVPFTGASLALMARRLRPGLCVVVGSTLGAVLLFVPYVNLLVFVGSLIYFVGYLVNITMFGHDEGHDRSFHARQLDKDAPHGKASGILPVAVTVADAAHEMDLDEPAIGFDDESAISEVSDDDADIDSTPAEVADAAPVVVTGAASAEVTDAALPVDSDSPAGGPSDAEGGGEPIWSNDAGDDVPAPVSEGE